MAKPKHQPHGHGHKHPHAPGKDHHHPHGGHPHKQKPVREAHHHPVPASQRPKTLVGTPRVKAVWNAVHTWFPRAASLGIYNRRQIAGSSRWSEHAWEDAWDVTDEESVKENQPSVYLRAIVRFLKRKRSELKITRIIFDDASHQNHAHVDCDPDHQGTPP